MEQNLNGLAEQQMNTGEATAKAKEIIRNYRQEVPAGDGDYSCNECQFDSYLCPHLEERLERHIVNGLTNGAVQ